MQSIRIGLKLTEQILFLVDNPYGALNVIITFVRHVVPYPARIEAKQNHVVSLAVDMTLITENKFIV